MKRILIVNADDFNLTRGVSQAILDCYDHGIVSSTTVLVNLPLRDSLVVQIKKRKELGVGIHLNVTLGEPVTKPKFVSSLLDKKGIFRRPDSLRKRRPRLSEVVLEYENQIKRFRKVFGRKPTHLDTHHQMHDHPLFFRALQQVAKKYSYPIRPCKQMKRPSVNKIHLLGDLRITHHWTKSKLMKQLKNLPRGVSEIMCHPGKVDGELEKVSSFTRGRHVEWQLFRSRELKKLLSRCGILLSHYGLWYTLK